MPAFLNVFLVFLKLGLTSFGGPIAHLGYFREEFVVRRRWVDEAAYADLVALCQFLPGPASSQVGIGLGTGRAGLLGGVAAWAGFTLPSAAAMVLFAYVLQNSAGFAEAGWLRGLKIVAVAVVALAVWGMARTLCPDRPRATIAVITAGTAVLWQQAAMQMALIALAGVAGLILLKDMVLPPVGAAVRTSVSRGVAIAALAVFVCLLLALPATWALTKNGSFAVIDSFYRVGSLVFGGGHVVLPLIESEVVEPGWVSPDQFAAGYGAAQAVPGPLFTFSAFLGAVMTPGLGGWLGGGVALVAVFAPSFLLVWGTLPFWDRLRGHLGARRALAGINAAVVGLLGAALYDPIWRTAVHTGADFAVALGAFGLLAFWRWPPWLVVALTAVAGLALPRLP